MRNKRVLTVIAALSLGGILFAASPYASVVYAEGASFTLIRAGKSVTVSAADPATIGMEIKPGDIIRTGSSTFVEIAINPISASIQIAENTSFRCDANSTGLESSGELYYGRVRAKVSKLSGNASYHMSSPSLTAGVRGTDFGLDVIAIRQSGTAGATGTSGGTQATTGSAPTLFRVFCFEGNVLVGSVAGTISDTLMIGGNEMVERVASSGSAKDELPPLEKKKVSTEVFDFWKVHPFAVISRLRAPVMVQTAGTGTSLAEQESAIQYAEPKKRLNTRFPQAGAVALAGLGTLTCAFAAYWSTTQDADARFIDPAYAAGTIMIGSGTVIAIASLLADR